MKRFHFLHQAGVPVSRVLEWVWALEFRGQVIRPRGGSAPESGVPLRVRNTSCGWLYGLVSVPLTVDSHLSDPS